MTESRYHYKQMGTIVVILLLLGVFAFASCALFVHTIAWMGAVLFLFLTFAFSSLTIEITDGKLQFWFGAGFVKRSYLLAEITETEIVTNPFYYGWGIHLTPDGWLYNIKGLQAVRITFENGKKIRLGTDKPEELKEKLDSK